jgi:hypothetical protein
MVNKSRKWCLFKKVIELLTCRGEGHDQKKELKKGRGRSRGRGMGMGMDKAKPTTRVKGQDSHY